MLHCTCEITLKTCPPPKIDLSDPSLALALCWGSVKRWRWSRPCSQQFCGCFSVSRCCPCEPWQAAVRMVLEERPNMEREDVGCNTTAEGFWFCDLISRSCDILWHDFWVERTRSFSDSIWSCWNTRNRFWWFRRQKRSPRQEAMATQLK